MAAFSFVGQRSMTFTAVNRTPPMEAAMTTDCITHYVADAPRAAGRGRDLIASFITAAAVVLLLPGAALFMATLGA
jgi:hypothetical protein